MAVFDPDQQPLTPGYPVAGGSFFESGAGSTLNHIGFFAGGVWQPLGEGAGTALGEDVEAIFDYSAALLVAGNFGSAGGLSVPGLAVWNGSAWARFPDEQAASPSTFMQVGETLYAGGRFFEPGSTSQRVGVLRWSSPSWVSLGPNPPRDDVYALAEYEGQLVAGGDFNNCCLNPPAPGEYIARFDGAAWRPLGSGTNGRVRALCVFDPDGSGPQPELLIAGGSFSQAGGVAASNIAAWNGTSWSALGSGTTGQVRTLTVWRGKLVIGGDFFSAGGLTSPGLAFWGCEQQPPECYANCDGSTSTPVLSVADFACFLQRFAGGQILANCDQSTQMPVLNVADFTCFLQRFAAGCP